MAAGIERAESLPEDTVDLLLGATISPDGPRGVGSLDVKLGHDIFAFASGEFANSGDWTAAAGLKMRW